MENASPDAVVACDQHAAGRVEEREVAVRVPRGGDHQNVLTRNRQHVARRTRDAAAAWEQLEGKGSQVQDMNQLGLEKE